MSVHKGNITTDPERNNEDSFKGHYSQNFKFDIGS